MDAKKERKEKEKEDKKEKKEREKREKEEREREKRMAKSPRVAPTISGPILPPSMMVPLGPGGKTPGGSMRSSPPGDAPSPVSTGSISKLQQLLGDLPPGANMATTYAPARTSPAPAATGLPKPLDATLQRPGAGTKEGVLPPPPVIPVLKPIVKPRAAAPPPSSLPPARLPPPPDIPTPNVPPSEEAPADTPDDKADGTPDSGGNPLDVSSSSATGISDTAPSDKTKPKGDDEDSDSSESDWEAPKPASPHRPPPTQAPPPQPQPQPQPQPHTLPMPIAVKEPALQGSGVSWGDVDPSPPVFEEETPPPAATDDPASALSESVDATVAAAAAAATTTPTEDNSAIDLIEATIAAAEAARAREEIESAYVPAPSADLAADGADAATAAESVPPSEQYVAPETWTKSRASGVDDILPPPDAAAIAAASLWSDSSPLMVTPAPAPARSATPVKTARSGTNNTPPVAAAAAPSGASQFSALGQSKSTRGNVAMRLMLPTEQRGRAGTGGPADKPAPLKPGGSLRALGAASPVAAKPPRHTPLQDSAEIEPDAEALKAAELEGPSRRHLPAAIAATVEEAAAAAVAQTDPTAIRRHVPARASEDGETVVPLPAVEEATAQLVSLSPQASPRGSDEAARYGGPDESGAPTLLGATVERLVEELTPDRVPNARLLNVTLLTFRLAFKPRELYNALVDRWSVSAPASLPPEQWRTTRQAIRLRVLNVFKSWLERSPSEWRGSEMMEALADFVDRNSGETPSPASVLSRVMNRVRAGEAIQTEAELPLGKPPRPLLPSKRNPTSFAEIPPPEVARQLTLIDWALFKKLEMTELLGQAWKRDTRAKDAPNVIGLIARSDYMSGLVATEILRLEKAKDRAALIGRLLLVAEECRNLQNWNSCMAVLSGLRLQPIYRLQDTWSQLPPKAWELWDTLKEIIRPEDNYTKLRQLQAAPIAPAIPFLGVYLGDLIKLEENETFLPGTKMVNLTKLRSISEVVFRIQAMQRGNYSLEAVPGIQEFLTTAPVFDENQLFKQSMAREERKNAKK